MTMAILANSDGWIEKPATRTHRRAPLTLVPATMVTRQQGQADRPDDVAIGVEAVHVAHDEHGGHEERHADQQPLALLQGEGRRDAVDLGEADRAEQRRDGHEVGVGLRQVAALGDVDHEKQHEEDHAGDDRVAAQVVKARRVDRGVGDRRRHADQRQQRQLGVAPAHGTACA